MLPWSHTAGNYQYSYKSSGAPSRETNDHQFKYELAMAGKNLTISIYRMQILLQQLEPIVIKRSLKILWVYKTFHPLIAKIVTKIFSKLFPNCYWKQNTLMNQGHRKKMLWTTSPSKMNCIIKTIDSIAITIQNSKGLAGSIEGIVYCANNGTKSLIGFWTQHSCRHHL